MSDDKPQTYEEIERTYAHLDDEAFFALLDSYDPRAVRELTDPLDPDWDDVPEDVRRRHLQTVLDVDVDEDGNETIGVAIHTTSPHLWARARRLRERGGDADPATG